MENQNKLIVSSAPHIHEGSTFQRNVERVLALTPALLFSVYFWGIRALILSLTGAITAVVVEALIQ